MRPARIVYISTDKGIRMAGRLAVSRLMLHYLLTQSGFETKVERRDIFAYTETFDICLNFETQVLQLWRGRNDSVPRNWDLSCAERTTRVKEKEGLIVKAFGKY